MDKKLPDLNTADAMLEALEELGVSYLFSNLGSDHPAIIEALAKAKSLNRELPEVIISPHEYVALSAAHGYYLLSGQTQGVFIHTDVGTQNLGGSLHNAARSRVPVFIFSGETPSTMNGELPGSRNSHINYLQNVYDQRGIVRSYVKWEYDVRTGANVKDVVYRGMQLAESEPTGPVYLTAAREVLEESVSPSENKVPEWSKVNEGTLSDKGTKEIVENLSISEYPLVITSYSGRKKESVDELIRLCEQLALPVIESNGTHMNFPSNHDLHQGFQVGEYLEKADVVLVIDSDVPWVPTEHKPNEQCSVFHIDIDPIKKDMPLWHIPTVASYQADSYQALKQLNDYLSNLKVNESLVQKRRKRLSILHEEHRKEWNGKVESLGDVITPEFLSSCIRDVIDEDAIIFNETITNAMAVNKHLDRNKPGTLYGNGGSSLGWSGGASLGAKLAAPKKTIVNVVGDGSYLFSQPSSVQWISRRYQAPFLTVIYNNQGWNATKNNVLKLYPDGVAKRDDRYWVNFDQPANFSKIAEAAGGAYAAKVTDPAELVKELKQGLHEVRNGRSAVIDVVLPVISQQID
ncbi:thiamine pyrophosphate-requiring protein [Thalassobacillus sp. CUG 92003]|uniref:thiamine pyrophosphate-requiring protein n=1 Tax=Thalassobacillus sp. CUG 92003 TaxID=2736641 RepID=UPI0021036B5A|nr:thiamine pyrophosphate-requiring protein [Thalassobacillus sp. CUG 92003]